jgi:aconitate hydratase
VEERFEKIEAYAVKNGELRPFSLTLGDLTEEERRIILDGCLINYNRGRLTGRT